MSRQLEDNDLPETLLCIVQPVRPREGLYDAVGTHRLAVDEQGRQGWSIKTCQQAVDDNDDIELVFPDLIVFLLAGQPVIDIAIIGSNLLHGVLCAEHVIIVLHGFFHLVLIEGVMIPIFSKGVGNGDFREIR